MSAYVKYDPKLFELRRITSVPSTLDEFLIGESVLASTTSAYILIPAATVSFSSGYTPDENGTLIIDAETVTVSLSFWDEPGTLLYPGNRIEIRYAGKVLCTAVVDSTSLTYAADPDAARHGATRRVDFTATAAGTYAVLMGRTVKWTKLPKESAIKRIRRWVTVTGW